MHASARWIFTDGENGAVGGGCCHVERREGAGREVDEERFFVEA